MILVDTGPLVALCDPRDSRHEDALAHLTQLASAGMQTCEAVITEAVFHLTSQTQRRRLARIIDELDIDVASTQDAAFLEDAFWWLDKYADHQPDWADACLAVLCGRNSRLKVWTYDGEFRTVWRKPDGRQIPRAVRG